MSGDFWGDLGKGVTSGDFLGSAFSTLGSTVAGLLLANDQEDQQSEADEAARQDKLLAMQLEALKYKYGTGGGGGGGGGGAANKLTPAQIAAMIQNQHELKI